MIPKIAGYVCKWMSPKFVFGYTILVSLVRFFCGPLKAGPLFVSTFRVNVAKIMSYISWQSFSFALSTSTLFNVFLIQFSWSGLLRAWLKKKKNMLGKAAVLYTLFL